jgi:hypothetical protein
MTEHRLKTWPIYFEEILSTRKRFELRYNDRKFEVGDWLVLEEYQPARLSNSGHKEAFYTGRAIRLRVTYKIDLHQVGLQKEGDLYSHVVLSLENPCPRCGGSRIEGGALPRPCSDCTVPTR